jgi:spore germination cell wall hydrolase CwlJ-like protein
MIYNKEKTIGLVYFTSLITLTLVIIALFFGKVSAMDIASTNCIKNTVWAEARGESNEGKRAVAHVILNRAAERKKTPCQVVSERGQFAKGLAPRSFYFDIGSKDPTRGATYFRKKDAPRWGRLVKFIRVGSHTFYGYRK